MFPAKNIVHLAAISKIEVMAKNKDNSDPEDWSFEIPNAPYSNR